nr:glycosyltransferase [Bacteriovorax sp. HI3]
MSSNPEISILMGAYNCERTLDKAIQSILSQTFSNWEFIICDDGSKDKTWDILQKYKDDSRFVLIQNKKNIGLAATLNECFKKSRGQYVARQDADDVSLPQRFSKQLAFIKEHQDLDVMSSHAYLVDDDNVQWGMYRVANRPRLEDWAKGTQVIHACVLMRRKAMEDVNGYDATAIRVEDYDMWMRMLAKGKKFGNLLEPLYEIHWGWKDYKRKTIKDRLREIRFKFNLIKLNNFPWKYYLYLLKPMILVFLPNKFLYQYHRKVMSLEAAHE